MILKKYLIDCLVEEKETVMELLYIDNKIQYTNLTYDELLSSIQKVDIYSDFDNTLPYSAITDGEIESVIRVLISVPRLNTIYINRTNLGINKYLIERTNMYYEDKMIVLDTNSDYNSYKDINDNIIVCAFDEMTEAIINDFTGRSLVVMK